MEMTFARYPRNRSKLSTKRKVNRYDLRSVRSVRWCTDTWDGSARPQDGMVWDTIIAANHKDSPTIIASNGRWFENGSRESSGKQGDIALAQTLLDMKILFDSLCDIIASTAGLFAKCESASLQCTEKEADHDFLQLFLQHPTYRELYDDAQKTEHLRFTFDAKEARWEVTQTQPE